MYFNERIRRHRLALHVFVLKLSFGWNSRGMFSTAIVGLTSRSLFISTKKINTSFRFPGVGSATLGYCVAQTTSKRGSARPPSKVSTANHEEPTSGSEVCIGADSSLAGRVEISGTVVGVGLRPRRRCRRPSQRGMV